MSYWSQLWAIARKDLLLERRTKQSISAMVVFAIAATVTFNFALGAELDAARNVSLGLLWVVIWLSGTLGLNRTFSAETESHAIDAILIAPLERSAIFFGKLISLFISLTIFELILVPLFVIFFNQPFYRPAFIFVLLLGTLGYVAAGVFVGSIAVQTRSSYMLIPILILPLTLPVILAASSGSAEFLLPNPDWSRALQPILLVAVYDVIMLLTGFLFYNYVLEE